MKSSLRVLFALLILLTILCALAVGVSAEETDENAPKEEIAVEQEKWLSRVEALWLALTPSVGAVIAAAVVAYRVTKQFKDLRADVIANGQIAAIRKENKALQKNIEQLVRFQENAVRDAEGWRQSMKSMEQTVQKLELQMCRLEASMNEPEKGVMGHL